MTREIIGSWAWRSLVPIVVQHMRQLRPASDCATEWEDREIQLDLLNLIARPGDRSMSFGNMERPKWALRELSIRPTGNGYYESNAQNAYTLNNITANRDLDVAITIQLGGCGGAAPNCLPISLGWNYMVRLYRPRAEARDGTSTFPEAKPVN